MNHYLFHFYFCNIRTGTHIRFPIIRFICTDFILTGSPLFQFGILIGKCFVIFNSSNFIILFRFTVITVNLISGYIAGFIPF